MAVAYYPDPGAAENPVGGLWKQWDPSTGMFTEWDVDGNVDASRPLTADELAALAVSTNLDTVTSRLQAAVSVLGTDQAQFATVATQAATVRDGTAALTLAQLTTVVRQLAGAVAVLATNGGHLDRAAVGLIRLAIDQLDDTSGT